MITEEELKIIKQFIDNYETIMNKYEEYRSINDSIRKNIIFQKYNNSESNTDIINYDMISQELKKQTDEYRKKFLIEQIKTIEKDINVLEQYKAIGIEEKYIELYCGNLSEYFETNQTEEEPETKIYKPKEEILEKDYYYNKQTTITQIYIRIKYIHDFYNEENNNKFFLSKDFVEKNIEFFKRFKKVLITYNRENQNFINKLSMIQKTNEQKQKTK